MTSFDKTIDHTPNLTWIIILFKTNICLMFIFYILSISIFLAILLPTPQIWSVSKGRSRFRDIEITTQLPRGFGRLFCELQKFVLISEEMGACYSKEVEGQDPKWTTCPHCETRVLTRVVTLTYRCSINWFCCIPYCTEAGKDALHTCPKCNYAIYPIGKYTKKWWRNQWESLYDE